MARTAISSERTAITKRRVSPMQSPYGLRYNGTSNAYTDFGTSTFFDSTQPWSVYLEINCQEYFNFRQTGAQGILSVKTDQGVPFVFFEQSAATIGLVFGASSIFPALRVTNTTTIGLLLSSGFHGIQITFDGADRTSVNSYKLYIDGAEQSLTSNPAPSATNHDNKLGILGATFAGRSLVSKMYIWNGGTAISASSAANLYFDGTLPSGATLTHSYLFTEGSGSSVADSVGGVNGTNGLNVVWKNVNRGNRSNITLNRTLAS